MKSLSGYFIIIFEIRIHPRIACFDILVIQICHNYDTVYETALVRICITTLEQELGLNANEISGEFFVAMSTLVR